jgi:hypothetical protein
MIGMVDLGTAGYGEANGGDKPPHSRKRVGTQSIEEKTVWDGGDMLFLAVDVF